MIEFSWSLYSNGVDVPLNIQTNNTRKYNTIQCNTIQYNTIWKNRTVCIMSNRYFTEQYIFMLHPRGVCSHQQSMGVPVTHILAYAWCLETHQTAESRSEGLRITVSSTLYHFVTRWCRGSPSSLKYSPNSREPSPLCSA